MKQLLDQKQQPRSVIVRLVEQIFLPRRLFDHARFERRPEIAGGHAIEAMRLFAEALAQPSRRQRKQGADGFDTELEQRVTKLGLDIQAIERHRERPTLL